MISLPISESDAGWEVMSVGTALGGILWGSMSGRLE